MNAVPRADRLRVTLRRKAVMSGTFERTPRRRRHDDLSPCAPILAFESAMEHVVLYVGA
jgi:hypothetical protein